MTAVDRAAAELELQIAAMERQVRSLEQGKIPAELSGPATSPVESFTGYIKALLTPPAKTPLVPTRRTSNELFDVRADPLKDLEAEPIAFGPPPAPDLLTATAPRPASTVELPVEDRKKKLAQYLSAGSLKMAKPLKHVQRQTRNRFYMWLGLSCVAIWLLWVVIR
jgi:hypothetical protein